MKQNEKKIQPEIQIFIQPTAIRVSVQRNVQILTISASASCVFYLMYQFFLAPGKDIQNLKPIRHVEVPEISFCPEITGAPYDEHFSAQQPKLP